jgi:PrtD family type I secretion system ABC transporter
MTREISEEVKRGSIEIAVFSTVINLFLLVPAFYMMQVYDRVLPSSNVSTLLYLSLIAAGSLVFLAVMDAVRSVYCQRVALRIDSRLGEEAFLASMSSSNASGGDIQPLRDLSTVRGFVASKGLVNMLDLPFAPIFAAILYLVHPLLCLVTVVGAALLILMVLANQFVAQSRSLKANETAASAALLAQTFARNNETVRSMGMTENVVQVWGRKFASASMLQDSASTLNAAFAGSSRTLRMGLQLVILGTGAVLVMKHQMTAGMIFASSTISGRALQPIDQLVGGWKQIAEASKAWSRLKSSLQAAGVLTRDNLTLPSPSGRIQIRDVIWGPTSPSVRRKPVIDRVTLSIAAGESIAVLGASGSGKSTLAKLLAGIIDPSSGEVILDGADYRTWNGRQLGEAIGYLAQDVQLLPGTISQNIARFHPRATDEDVIGAAVRAVAHEMISGVGFHAELSRLGA